MVTHIKTQIFDPAEQLGWHIVTAESCTGGMVAAALTDPPGSSCCVAGGFVTYTNALKQKCLSVGAECLDTFGAVSDQTVAAMATGALAKANADLAVSVSGIAGPTGATPGKPLGLVHFAVQAQVDKRPKCVSRKFDGDRQTVRQEATQFALSLLAQRLADELKHMENA